MKQLPPSLSTPAFEMDLTGISSWEDVFKAHRVGEVRRIKENVKLERSGKKAELRKALGGRRYHDLLKTTDAIREMERKVLDEDAMISAICDWRLGGPSESTVKRRLGAESCPPRGDLEREAVHRLLKQSIASVRRLLQAPLPDVVTTARGCYLMDLLVSATGGLRRDEVSGLENRLRERILAADWGSSDPERRAVDYFFAYQLVSTHNSRGLIDVYLADRLAVIESGRNADNGSRLASGLAVYGTTMAVARDVFGRNDLSRMMGQQRWIGGGKLLGSEFVTKCGFDVDRFMRLLPKQIVDAPIVPEELLAATSAGGTSTTTTASTADVLPKKLEEFMSAVLKPLTAHLEADLQHTDSPQKLASYYHDILELFRDSSTLRGIADGRGKPWLEEQFYHAWRQRYEAVVAATVDAGKQLHSALEAKAAALEANGSPPEDSHSLFSKSSSLAVATITSENVQSIFSSLDNIVIGQTGDCRDIVGAFRSWFSRTEELRRATQDYSARGGLILSGAAMSVDDFGFEEDDPEWKAAAQKALVATSGALMETIDANIRSTFETFIGDAAAQLAKSSQARTMVFIARSVLSVVDLAARHSVEIKQETYSGLLDDLYNKIGETIASNSIPKLEQARYESVDMSLWTDGLPSSPSFYLLSELQALVSSLCGILGYDSALWDSKLSKILCDKIGERLVADIAALMERVEAEPVPNVVAPEDAKTDAKDSVSEAEAPHTNESASKDDAAADSKESSLPANDDSAQSTDDAPATSADAESSTDSSPEAKSSADKEPEATPEGDDKSDEAKADSPDEKSRGGFDAEQLRLQLAMDAEFIKQLLAPDTTPKMDAPPQAITARVSDFIPHVQLVFKPLA